jgi:hypothetical protein
MARSVVALLLIVMGMHPDDVLIAHDAVDSRSGLGNDLFFAPPVIVK